MKKEEKKCKKECSCEEKNIENKEDSNTELLDSLKRLQAEFDNYRKQQEKQKALFRIFTKKDLMLKLIPIVDLFDLALSHKENREEFVKGIELINLQLTELLTKEGIQEIKEKKFNPEFHEAILTGKGKEGEILETLQKGYKFENVVIRPARVKVGKGGKNE